MSDKQELVKLEIPRTCKECYESDFKKERPHCPYEKAIHLKKMLNFFRNDLELPLQVTNVNIEALKMQAAQCCKELPKRAEKIQQQLMMRSLLDTVGSLKDEVQNIKDNQKNGYPETNIFKKEKEMDTPVKKVKKDKKKPDIKLEHKGEKKKKEPFGGWKFYLRNVKEDNLNKYLEKMKDHFPELKKEIDKVINGEQSEAVAIDYNSNGNCMIKYREFKE